ncbi:hypothetical protein GCM10010254_36630 [Streptomyces chromofuscus]|nr:hypothetical protein GCM10010254_36630 [Streptomyces chromofuscus]
MSAYTLQCQAFATTLAPVPGSGADPASDMAEPGTAVPTTKAPTSPAVNSAFFIRSLPVSQTHPRLPLSPLTEAGLYMRREVSRATEKGV